MPGTQQRQDRALRWWCSGARVLLLCAKCAAAPKPPQLLLENYAMIGATHEQQNAGRLADALA